jgi:hypothetical protein
MELYIITERTEHRDWGEITFDVLGVWPIFEKALEYLKAERRKLGFETDEIKFYQHRAHWRYSDWEGKYEYKIEPIKYYEL